MTLTPGGDGYAELRFEPSRRPAMKQLLLAATVLLALASLARAQDRITLQLKWLPQAQFAGYYVAKDKGFYKDLGLDVTIAQIFQRSGMMLVCRKESGIATPQDFKGHTLAVWFAGNEYPFLAWMDKLGYRTSGDGGAAVKVLRQGADIDPLLQGQADCVSAMTYNEYWQALD